MVRSTSLSLGIPSSASPISSNVTSPRSPRSIPSSPGSTTAGRAHGGSREPQSRFDNTDYRPEEPPLSPEFTSLPPFPASPDPKGSQESKGFFANLKASKSSNKVNNVPEPTIRQVSEEISRSKYDLSEGGSVYSRKSPGSTPDLTLGTLDTDSTEFLEGRSQKVSEQAIPRRPVGSPTLSDDATRTRRTENSQMKKPKPRFTNLINRTRSTKTEELPRGSAAARSGGGQHENNQAGAQRIKNITPIITTTTPAVRLQLDGAQEYGSKSGTPMTPNTPQTAPLPQDRSFNNDKNLKLGIISTPRNRSADRSLGHERGQGHDRHQTYERTQGQERGQTQETVRQENRYATSGFANSSREPQGSHLLSNIKNTSSRAAGGLNKAGKGIFAKMGRSGSSNNQNLDEQRYVCRIINLPLVEQTRKTRIAARLENSKDKTEFWMPALPWRCIDYLNFRGCEEEGLYRVPGSDREIRLWQRRFDQGKACTSGPLSCHHTDKIPEGDINLFDEENLYDINIIGSLFKGWLRELPTEIFPKATQIKIYQANPNAEEVPKMLKDELSKLPPWNYYLLFAITCHLSLLTAYSEKNRMSYGNLVICFQPCLKIDNFCFQFLVQQWRDCWQGCWTEKETLIEEYKIIDGTSTDLAPGSSGNSSGGSTAVGGEDRSAASTASTQNQLVSNGRPQQHRPPPLTLSTASQEQIPSSNGKASQNGHARSDSQLPALAPVRPLSPIGF